MKNRVVLTLIFISFFGIQSKAQESSAEIQMAFSKSYEYEYTYKYDEAIKVLKTITKNSQYEINIRLGWLNYLKGEHTQSVAFYKKAIALIPSSTEARLGIANPLSYLGNWSEIEIQYLSILKYDSKNYTANYRMALIKYNVKEYNSAVKYINLLTELYPFDYDVNLLAAQINISLGNISVAKNHLHRCLLYNPLSEEAKALFEKL